MIVGSFPIGKFSNPKRRHEIKPHEFDFPFGGEKNLLWKLLGEVFNKKLTSKEEIVKLLVSKKIALGDVIKSCRRKDGGGSDSDLYDIIWNKELIKVINDNNIKKIFFTSKKVESWFNKLFPDSDHLEKITLISPSAQSVRSLHKHPDYEKWHKHHPDERRYDFILFYYRAKFKTIA